MMTVEERIIDAAAAMPMRTEAELAHAIFGYGSGYQQRVNSTCRALVAKGRLKRHGRGGGSDPFRYSVG